MKPRWMRMNAACPDCGYVLKDENDGFTNDFNRVAGLRGPTNFRFDCPRCKAHFTGEDFWREHRDKYAHVWSEHQGESACR